MFIDESGAYICHRTPDTFSFSAYRKRKNGGADGIRLLRPQSPIWGGVASPRSLPTSLMEVGPLSNPHRRLVRGRSFASNPFRNSHRNYWILRGVEPDNFVVFCSLRGDHVSLFPNTTFCG